MLEREAAPCLRASVVRPWISAAPKECRRRTPTSSSTAPARMAARRRDRTVRACTPPVTYRPRSHGGSETVQPDPAHNLTLYARRVLMFEGTPLRASGVATRFGAATTRVTYGPRRHGDSETIELAPLTT
jgi:hypothetical protein